MKTFAVIGINVLVRYWVYVFKLHELTTKITLFQRSASNESQVSLAHVQPTATGKYSCEVSADAPSFHTEIATKDLEVVGKFNCEEITTCDNCNCNFRRSLELELLFWILALSLDVMAACFELVLRHCVLSITPAVLAPSCIFLMMKIPLQEMHKEGDILP